MNKKNILTLILIIILIIGGLSMKAQQPSHYAKITGENFTIPKIEGDYYYER